MQLPSLYWYGHSQNPQASKVELSVFIRMYFFFFMALTYDFFTLSHSEKKTQIFDKLFFLWKKARKCYLSQSIVIVKKKKCFRTDEAYVHSRNISESSVHNITRKGHKR